MEFGEIVEPSTRALIDDGYEEYPDYVEPVFEWESNNNPVPANIDCLIIIENSKVIKLFELLILDAEHICNLKNGVLEIYKLENDKYIVLFCQQDIPTGQLVEAISKWLENANHIYTITSVPIATYLNFDLLNKPECLIRILSTSSSTLGYKKLEAPNLVTGFGANVLSYCVHMGLECTLFVMYTDTLPLDSINSKPLMQLMKKLDLNLKKTVGLNVDTFSSNLYM